MVVTLFALWKDAEDSDRGIEILEGDVSTQCTLRERGTLFQHSYNAALKFLNTFSR